MSLSSQNCSGKYSKGLKNEDGEHPVNLCEPNNLEMQFIFPNSSIVNKPELYFLLKVQITYKSKQLVTELYEMVVIGKEH